MADVQLKEVDKIYEGDVHAVQDLSLYIKDGEFLVLVGPSGCGKTTALRMIAGLEEISDGTVTIGDRVVNDLSPKDRDIAMVFQNYALYPHLSVADNIGFGLRLRKMPKDVVAERIAWAAKLLDLTPYLDAQADASSRADSGSASRWAARSSASRRSSSWTSRSRTSTRSSACRCAPRSRSSSTSSRTTTIYVTHDQVEAMTMGDRVAVMSMGVLQQVDTSAAPLRRAVNLFVAGFIGTPPMNLFEGRRAFERRRVSVTIGASTLPVAPVCLARYCGVAHATDARSSSASAPRTCIRLAARPDLPTLDGRDRARRGARLGLDGATSTSTRQQVRPEGARGGGAAGGGRERGRRAPQPHRAASRRGSTCGSATPSRSRSTPPACTSSTRRRVPRFARLRKQIAVARRGLRRCALGASRRDARATRDVRRGRASARRRARRRSRSRSTYSSLAIQRIYFVMPDRYANGDPANDRGGASGGRSVTGYDPADIGWYHGGDLKGLTGVVHRPADGSRADQGARLHGDLARAGRRAAVRCRETAPSYHGYWGLDFTRVDPHLGTDDDFKAFADCAHGLGLKVYLDVVVNHTADVDPPLRRDELPLARRDAVPRLQGQAVLRTAVCRRQALPVRLRALPAARSRSCCRRSGD